MRRIATARRVEGRSGLAFTLLAVAMFVWGVVMPFMGLFYTVQLLT